MPSRTQSGMVQKMFGAVVGSSPPRWCRKFWTPENIDFWCWRYCRCWSLCDLRALETRVAFVAEHSLEVHTFLLLRTRQGCYDLKKLGDSLGMRQCCAHLKKRRFGPAGSAEIPLLYPRNCSSCCSLKFFDLYELGCEKYV